MICLLYFEFIILFLSFASEFGFTYKMESASASGQIVWKSYADMVKTHAPVPIVKQPIQPPVQKFVQKTQKSTQPAQKFVKKNFNVRRDTFNDLNDLYTYATQRRLSGGVINHLIREHFGVGNKCAQMIDYVSARPRGTDAHIKRLVLADKIPGFDWDSVTKGDEEDELQKYGI